MKNKSPDGTFFIILFWVILFSLCCFQIITQTESALAAVLFSLVLILCLSFPLTYINRKILVKTIKKGKYALFIFQLIASSILSSAIFASLFFLMDTLEIKGIFPRSEYFELIYQNPKNIIELFLSMGLTMNLCVFGFCFVIEYLNSQKVILEYQLRTLKHQVTPHFMFNVLNHIHVLMRTDVKLASTLLIKYSEILRYQLYNGEEEKMSLDQEIQFLKDFITVEDVRWGDKLTLNCTWQIEDGKIEIPTLLFITFIENAFKHVSKSDFEKGYIIIDFKQQGDTITLIVENSKSAIQDKSNTSKGLGLKNIKERMDILYNGKHQIIVNETDLVYRVKVIIGL
ncbi:MAG: histidine kinase [Prevotella sp.]|nr:histidine kinase [Prevotella sp.]